MFLILHKEQWLLDVLIEASLVSPATLLEDNQMNSLKGMKC